MISRVRSIITLLSDYLGDGVTPFPIVRKEQSGLKQVYPFGAYKVTTLNGDPYLNRGQVENLDPTKVSYLHSKTEEAIVSLSFYVTENAVGIPKPTIDLIYENAYRSIDYLQVIGKDPIRDLDLVVELFETTVQDRTLYLEPVYEYQVGFDFKVRSSKELIQNLDAVDMDATIAGVEYNYE